LASSWNGDGTSDPPIDPASYDYQSTVKVYDSLGSTHDVTVYFDKDTGSTWEYIITINPDEDNRTGFAGTVGQGLLGRGSIVYNEGSGSLQSLTMDRLIGTDPTVPANWAAQATNVDGYFEFQADFIGGAATTQDIAFDMGTRWDGVAFAPDSLSSTQYASSSTTVYQSATGYGPGALQGVDVDVEGLITGVYSNGQVIPLYRISLAKFQSLQGLYKEGGNLYRETRQSGPAITGLPGTNGLGSIAPNSLEQSNVDIANEFVKMITTQRGFQANSKIITVTDQMLSELINLKR